MVGAVGPKQTKCNDNFVRGLLQQHDYDPAKCVQFLSVSRQS